ncbi:MAG: NACHT domain-containing protein [Xanthomonadales bacterium]|nr:NACHT domain-containing protein [Xanthomonadales bacterium]
MLIVHAEGEESWAELLAEPIRKAGYEPIHYGTILVGDSFTEEASNLLAANGPLVLCGTIKAAGTGLPYRLLNAARSQRSKIFIFPVRMEANAHLEVLALGARISEYHSNPAQGVSDLLTALLARCPLDADTREMQRAFDLESRYRALTLCACDIVDLANLPEDDRHLASRELELRRLYVALRLRLEGRIDDEVGEQTLLALEAQRRAGWGAPRERQEAETKLVSVGERLAAAKRLVVLGDPGAGKSTLLRWIATAYLLRLQADGDWQALPDIASLPANDWLPILIRCRDLPPETVTLDSMLQHTLRKSELTEDQCDALKQLLRGKLERGEALLLIDGLDEVTDPSARIRLAEQIELIHRAHPLAPVVATSRIVGYREMGHRIRAGFEHLTVADLSHEDKDDFARRWCALTEQPDRQQAAAAELINDIHSSDRIERLTGNPMLLTTMALIKRKIGRLPQRRVDLYEKAVEVLLNWRSAVDTALDDREALPQLEYIAHAMCAEGIQQLREDQALDLLRQCRTDYPNIHPLTQHSPEDFLALLERRTGLLIQSGYSRHQGRSRPVYEFRHLTLQEFLAGLALVQGHYRGREAGQSLAEVIAPLAGQVGDSEFGVVDAEADMAVVENWREAIRLCLALCPDEQIDGALRGVLRPLPGELETARPRAVQAALCLADEPNVSPEVAGDVIQSLIAAIRPCDGEGYVNSSLDAAIVQLAGSRWASPTAEALLDQFFRESEPFRRSSSGSLYAILQRKRNDQDTSRLAQATILLKQATEREAASVALMAMEMAYEGTEYKFNDLAEGLTRWLSGGAAVSHAAAWALAWITDKPNKSQSVDLGTVELARVVEAIERTDCDSEALYFLSWIVASHRTTEAVPALLRQLPYAPPRTQSRILSTVGEVGGKNEFVAIASYLGHSSEEVRRAALGALAQTREELIDRALLAERSYAKATWLDPGNVISEAQVARAAETSGLHDSEVRERYEQLAELFDLKLSWAKTTARRQGQV